MNYLQSLKLDFKQYVFLLKMKIKLKIHMKLADYKHFITNKRYFVTPAVGYGMRVLCNTEIKHEKKGKGQKPRFHFETQNGKKMKVYDKTNGPDKHSICGTSKKERKNARNFTGMKKTDGYNEIKEKCFYMTDTFRGKLDKGSFEEREAMKLNYERFVGLTKRIDPKI